MCVNNIMFADDSVPTGTSALGVRESCDESGPDRYFFFLVIAARGRSAGALGARGSSVDERVGVVCDRGQSRG